MGEKIRASWEKLDSALTRPLPSQRSTDSRSVSPIGPALRGKYRSPIDNWDKLRGMWKSPSATRASPENNEILRSQSQRIVRAVSKGRILFKPQFAPHSLPFETLERIYIEKCSDMGIQVLGEQFQRFLEFCGRNIKDRRHWLEECGLGIRAVSAVAGIVTGGSDFSYLHMGRNPLGCNGALVLMRAISTANRIVHLGLNSTDLTPDGVVEVCNLLETHPSVTSLDLSSLDGLYRNRISTAGGQALSSLLSHNSVLSVLNISGTGLGTEGAIALSQGLSLNTSLLWLDISNNSLSGKLWEALSRAVSTSHLQYLDISDNKLTAVGTESIGKLLGGVWGPCPLVRFNAVRCDINVTAAKLMFAGLAKNAKIATLALDYNPLGSASLIELFQFLSENSVIKELSLVSCGLRDDSILDFCEGLSKNRSLLSLNLSQNMFEDIGALALADALRSNTVLRSIDLSTNRIKEAGGAALSQCLHDNRSLETVVLKDNFIDDNSGRIIAGSLGKNRSILRVALESNPVSSRFIREIERSVSANRIKKQRSITPVLRNEVRNLRVPENAFEKIRKEVEELKKTQKTVEMQLATHRERLFHVQDEENEKFAILAAELEAAKALKLQRAAEYKEIQAELKLESAFFQLATDVHQLEKSCKRLKESYALRRAEAQQRLEEAKAHRNKEASFKQLAQFSLDSMRHEIESSYRVTPSPTKSTAKGKSGKQTGSERYVGSAGKGGKPGGNERK